MAESLGLAEQPAAVGYTFLTTAPNLQPAYLSQMTTSRSNLYIREQIQSVIYLIKSLFFLILVLFIIFIFINNLLCQDYSLNEKFNFWEIILK